MEDKHALELHASGVRGQLAFVLRMWSADHTWQASLQDVKTSQRVGFASLEELFAYLMNIVEKHGDGVVKPDEGAGVNTQGR